MRCLCFSDKKVLVDSKTNVAVKSSEWAFSTSWIVAGYSVIVFERSLLGADVSVTW